MSPTGAARIHHPGERLECRYLAPWLDVATGRLSDESKARVREEIREHFHDAVDTGIRDGLSAENAAEQAVACFGSPRSAGRAFRRVYLTKRQEAMLSQYGEPSRIVSAGFVLLTSLAIWQSVLIEPRWTEPGWPLRIIAALGMVLALAVLTLLSPRIYRRGDHRVTLVVGMGANLLWWSCLLVAVTGQIAVAWWLPPAAACAIAFQAPLLRKLGDAERRPA